MIRPETILDRLRERPFRPLRIIASEGLAYEIRHPDLVLVGERDVIIGLPTSANTSIYQRTIRVALIHVVGLEELPVQGETNGPG